MKDETLIFILIVAGVIGISLGFVMPAIMSEKTPQAAVKEEKAYINYTNYTILVSAKQNVCEECHLSGKKFIPQAYEIKEHTRGGGYCLKCHVISHEKHPVNENVTCSKCHGSIFPRIPAVIDGETVCTQCHAFPDSLMPSYGNLISIHKPRHISCTACHVDCTQCHDKILINERWDKRIKHLDILSRVYK